MMEEFTKGVRQAILEVIAYDVASAAADAVEDKGGTEEQMEQAWDFAWVRVYAAFGDSTNDELLIRVAQISPDIRTKVADGREAAANAANAVGLALLDPTTMSRL